MNKLIFLALIPVIMLIVPNVYAGGARSDWSDHYDNIPGAPKCWQDGYDDGQNGPFDQVRHEECIVDIPEDIKYGSEFNEPYYEAFIYGCQDAGNTEETCERFTDA
ncbi:MAG: hypothetical protein ACRD8W_08885 [Nitrososphaeraceae archaeon]